MVQVMLPCSRWDTVALLLLESVRNLQGEGQTELVAEVVYTTLPAIILAASAAVRLEYNALLAELAEGCPQEGVA